MWNPNSLAPKILVATLTWNRKDLVLRCLQSLIEIEYPNFEIAVVDNRSNDGTFETLMEGFPKIHLIRYRENFGFGEGVNGQVRFALESGADFLMSVDNDAVVARDILLKFVDAARRNPQVGIFFPKVFYFGEPKKIWASGGEKIQDQNWWKGEFPGIVRDVEDDGSYDRECESHFFPGGFHFVRVEAIKKVGYLNPDYFIYFDDADWFFRFFKAGYEGRYIPQAHVWHEPSATIGGDSEVFHYYQTRNRLFFVKHCCPSKKLWNAYLAVFSQFIFKKLPNLCERASWRRSSLRGQAAEYCLSPKGASHFAKDQKLIGGLLRGEFEMIRGIVTGFVDFLRGKKRNKDFEAGRKNFVLRVFLKAPNFFEPFVRKVRFSFKKWLGMPLYIHVRIDWNIGDEIFASPVYEALKRKYPNSVIHAQARTPQLLEGNPFVDSASSQEKSKCDLRIDLHYDVRHRIRSEYLAELAGVSTWGLPKIYLRQEELESVGKKWNLSGEGLRIAVNPEVGWYARRWPRKNWIECVKDLQDRYDAQIFIVGTEEREFPLGINLIRKTTVRESAALIQQCHLFLGHDSGPLYIALSVGTPSVGLFGPLDPHLLYPQVDHFISIWSEVECRGCWPDYRMKLRDHCPKIAADCMTSIPVFRVTEAADRLLAAQKLVKLAI